MDRSVEMVIYAINGAGQSKNRDQRECDLKLRWPELAASLVMLLEEHGEAVPPIWRSLLTKHG